MIGNWKGYNRNDSTNDKLSELSANYLIGQIWNNNAISGIRTIRIIVNFNEWKNQLKLFIGAILIYIEPYLYDESGTVNFLIHMMIPIHGRTMSFIVGISEGKSSFSNKSISQMNEIQIGYPVVLIIDQL